MIRYWELKGDPEGRRFCFTTEAYYLCPFADGPPQWAWEQYQQAKAGTEVAA